MSHVDLHATILDYLGSSKYDTSDGCSLRRFINGTSYNKYNDEQAVVVELDDRVPKSSSEFDHKLGGKCLPNFIPSIYPCIIFTGSLMLNSPFFQVYQIS